MAFFLLRSDGGTTPTTSVGSPGVQNLWETFSADAGGPLSAQNPNDTLDFTGGSPSTGISTTLSLVGSPEVATLIITSLNDHGSLDGLGDDDHPQYTLNAYDSITDGTNTESASGRNNTIQFEAGASINVTVGSVGSPEVDSVTISNTAPSPTGLTLTVINGQTFLTLEDSSRLTGSPEVSKILTISEHPLLFAENKISDLDWLQIGNASDADSGYIADFNGTVVWATGHCESTGANSKDIHLFINGIDQGSIGSLSGGANATFINTTLNLNFDQGDRIRLQAQGASGRIEDTVIKVTLKWRGN